LQACGGNREAAAAMLGISRTTLWRRLKRIGAVRGAEQG
jgi:transcriptional regulator of acetoin/glycerol metabolism